jgi:hypothetical protein
VDREVASAPKLCRLQKRVDRATAWRLHQFLVEQFIAGVKSAPEELALDLDERPLQRSLRLKTTSGPPENPCSALGVKYPGQCRAACPRRACW